MTFYDRSSYEFGLVNAKLSHGQILYTFCVILVLRGAINRFSDTIYTYGTKEGSMKLKLLSILGLALFIAGCGSTNTDANLIGGVGSDLFNQKATSNVDERLLTGF